MIIEWKPDRDINESLQSQIFRYFVACISNGDLSIGMRLPSERKLAEMLEVNRSTVTSVFNELKAEGVIESRGSGGHLLRITLGHY